MVGRAGSALALPPQALGPIVGAALIAWGLALGSLVGSAFGRSDAGAVTGAAVSSVVGCLAVLLVERRKGSYRPSRAVTVISLWPSPREPARLPSCWRSDGAVGQAKCRYPTAPKVGGAP